MSSMIDWAKYYARQGLSVIPVSGKTPLIKWAEFQGRIASEEEIKGWYEKWPEADIGLVTGAIYNLLVLDIDSEEAHKTCSAYGIPSTRTVRSRRGVQYYFVFPQGFKGKTTIAGLLPDTDTRGDGGYVKAPPSQFSDSSGRYSVQLDAPPAECPDWLLKLLEEKNKPRQIDRENGESWLKEKLDSLTLGNRNSVLTSIAGLLRSQGWRRDDIYLFLEPHAERVSFEKEELQTICQSVGAYTPKVQQNVQEAQSVSDFLADEQKVEWIVPGILAKRSIGFIAGLQETNKTWIAMDLAIEAARGGGHWLGKFPVNGAKVLFIDQERFKGETQRRLAALIGEKRITPASFGENLIVQCGTTTRLNLQQSFDSFRKKLGEVSPQLVIVDSFATFHTVTENDRMEIQKVIELIKQLRNEFGCTFLFINHESKGVLHHEPGEHKAPHSADMMGSIAVPAAAELVLTVRRKDEETSMCYMTKNSLATKIEPFEVRVVDADEGKTKIRVEGK